MPLTYTQIRDNVSAAFDSSKVATTQAAAQATLSAAIAQAAVDAQTAPTAAFSPTFFLNSPFAWDDFDEKQATNTFKWSIPFTNGTGAAASVFGYTAAPDSNNGIAYLTSGTTSTGSASIGSPSTGALHYLTFDKGEINARCGFQLPVLPTTAENFVFRFGLLSQGGTSGQSAINTTNQPYGCIAMEVFLNASNQAEVRFIAIDVSSSVATATSIPTGITLTAGVWYNFWIRNDSNSNISRLYYCAYGSSNAYTLIATITSNNPKKRTVSGYYGGCTFSVGMNKTAGTTARLVYLDYIGYDYAGLGRISI